MPNLNLVKGEDGYFISVTSKGPHKESILMIPMKTRIPDRELQIAIFGTDKPVQFPIHEQALSLIFSFIDNKKKLSLLKIKDGRSHSKGYSLFDL